ncbi:MAG: glucoamylase family protein [Candidatus Competibacter sp.]|nr:glucoamylase family protein [Candidatus Competibacter sp.]
MRACLFGRLILLGGLLFRPDWAAPAIEPAMPPLVLHDFEQTTSPTPGVGMSGWTADPAYPTGQVRYRREPARRPGSERALHLHYRFDPGATDAIGWQLALPDLDATAYDHLELWFRGDGRAGFADSFEIEFKQPLSGGPPGLLRQGSYLVTGIADDWQRIRVPLNVMNGITDWKHLRQFTVVFEPRRSSITRGAYWLDDIALIHTGQPGPSIHDPVIPPKKTAWENGVGGKAAAQSYIRARLAGWPERLTVDPAELPGDDPAFLARLARDTWRGLAALSDREHGLPFDTVRFGGSIALDHAWLGDYTNVTNIGFYLIDIVAARELGLIDGDEARARLNRTLDTLERLETWRGFHYNYYDTTTLERTSHFISFVDSAWLTAGLMVTRNGVPELAGRCDRLIDQGDYRVFYDPVQQLMMHGYYTNLPYRSEYSYGLLYSEARLGSLIAIGKGDAPEEHWYRMARTFPRHFDWQSQSPKNRADRTVNGHTFPGGHYAWHGLQYVPSWGGSLFEALMPLLVLDELRYAPASLGRNDLIHTQIHRRFALEHLGYPVWGLSPSSAPVGGYREFGVRILGVRGYPGGAVTPHAAALGLLTEPAEAAANLRQLAERYPIYGDFGFYDAVDPKTGQVAYNYLALDQSMILIALANHLRDGAIQRYFAADPLVRRMLPLLGSERFFD